MYWISPEDSWLAVILAIGQLITGVFAFLARQEAKRAAQKVERLRLQAIDRRLRNVEKLLQERKVMVGAKAKSRRSLADGQ